MARAVARDAVKWDRGVNTIVVQRITDGLYMVELTCVGESEPERYLYADDDLAEEPRQVIPPSGDPGGKRNG